MRLVPAAELTEFANRGIVFSDNFSKANCDGLLYEVRLGRKWQSVTTNQEQFQTIDGLYHLRPREVVNVEVFERFNLNDEAGRPVFGAFVISSARHLAGGLSHHTTLIDPGFKGTASITLENMRNFPTRAFRPGQDSVAKLLVFEMDPDEVPESWEATSAFVGIGPSELPRFWSDIHLSKPWVPVHSAHQDQLDELSLQGPPFDVIAAQLRRANAALGLNGGSGDSRVVVIEETVRESTLAIRDLVSDSVRNVARVNALEDASLEVRERVSDIEGALRADRSEKVSTKRESRRFWIMVSVTLLAALVGAVVGSVLTLWLAGAEAGGELGPPTPGSTSNSQTMAYTRDCPIFLVI